MKSLIYNYEMPSKKERYASQKCINNLRTAESATDCMQRRIAALFTNMRILKFKSQLTIAFFAAVNHLNGPLRKQNFTLTGSKGQGCDL